MINENIKKVMGRIFGQKPLKKKIILIMCIVQYKIIIITIIIILIMNQIKLKLQTWVICVWVWENSIIITVIIYVIFPIRIFRSKLGKLVQIVLNGIKIQAVSNMIRN